MKRFRAVLHSAVSESRHVKTNVNVEMDVNPESFQQGTSLLESLPYEILSLVLSHLPPAQIFRSEGVSKFWQQLVHGWVQNEGYEHIVESDRLRTIATEPKNRASYSILKRQDMCTIISKEAYCIENGKVLSDATEDKSVRARDIFDPRTLKPVTILKLLYNEHQTVLVRLEAKKSDTKLVSVAVYSLAKRKTLFQRDYSTMVGNSLEQTVISRSATIPYMLGKSRLYTATNIDHSRNHYVLECYNFRTQERVFQTDILGDDWFNVHTKFDATNAEGAQDHSLFTR
ncbi:hypothetical protein BDW69DRAFT_181678 [Aspergillus filifer]